MSIVPPADGNDFILYELLKRALGTTQVAHSAKIEKPGCTKDSLTARQNGRFKENIHGHYSRVVMNDPVLPWVESRLMKVELC